MGINSDHEIGIETINFLEMYILILLLVDTSLKMYELGLLC